MNIMFFKHLREIHMSQMRCVKDCWKETIKSCVFSSLKKHSNRIEAPLSIAAAAATWGFPDPTAGLPRPSHRSMAA